MPIKYNGQKLIPAPFVGISKEYIRSSDGNKVGSTFSISVEGTLLPCKGSPSSSGTFWGIAGYPADESIDSDEVLASFLQKEEAIRELFAHDGLLFEIEPWDGSPATTFRPRVLGIDFPSDQWVDNVTYAINLEADEVFGIPGAEDVSASGDFFLDSAGNKLYLQDVGEDWALEHNDTPEGPQNGHSFRLTHNVSAVGKHSFDSGGIIQEPWEQARRWVVPRLGIDNTFLQATSGLNLAAYYTGFNHVRSENTDKFGGSYTVSETWVISSGNVFEDFTVTTTSSTDSGKTQVSVEGLITGLDTRDVNFQITESKWDAASAKFASINPTTIYTRATSYSGVTSLNSNALNSTIGRNPNAGTVNYSISFDTRPSTCIPGALSENIQIADVNPHDIFASIGVLGRYAGPILQDIGSRTEQTRTVTVDVIMSGIVICPNTEANAAAMIAASPKADVAVILNAFYLDLSTNYDQVFRNQDTENWVPWDGRYSRTIGWTIQSC